MGEGENGSAKNTQSASMNISASVCVRITYTYINSIMGKFVNGKQHLDEALEWLLAQKLCLFPLVV